MSRSATMALLIAGLLVSGCAPPADGVSPVAAARLEGAAAQLRTAPTAVVIEQLLDDGFVPTLDDDAGQIVGTLAVADGAQCAAVTVAFPERWLVDGSGTVDVSSPHVTEDSRC